ncbi:hypothetical protein [Arsenicicoccus dermatophilus]|uniref:hypothetical protein n=1 Tax=Arsenicicoccus dermatophilus TaxID=1076331 RepID=UPI001F4CFDE3|nr:hypothetical protein [Arsenicicoccus dermatophilus]MCH8614482.1 hypothetical protein [Arsenicicoccus dermatophilus]
MRRRTDPTRAFATIYRHVLRSGALSWRGVATYVALRSYAGCALVCPTRAGLASRAGISVKTVDAGLRELTAAGYVRVVPRWAPSDAPGGRSRTSSAYELLDEPGAPTTPGWRPGDAAPAGEGTAPDDPGPGDRVRVAGGSGWGMAYTHVLTAGLPGRAVAMYAAVASYSGPSVSAPTRAALAAAAGMARSTADAALTDLVAAGFLAVHERRAPARPGREGERLPSAVELLDEPGAPTTPGWRPGDAAPTMTSPRVVETPAPAPAVVVETPAPAPAVVVETPAPAPAVVVETPAPAPAVVVETPAPAPAVVVETPAPAPAVVVETPAPAPADRRVPSDEHGPLSPRCARHLHVREDVPCYGCRDAKEAYGRADAARAADREMARSRALLDEQRSWSAESLPKDRQAARAAEVRALLRAGRSEVRA